jgi:outer membrane usher protein
MWRLLAFLVLVMDPAHGGSAKAFAALPPVAPVGSDQSLFVELVVNGQSSGEIVPLRVSGDRLLVDGALLRQAGLRIDGDGPRDVAHQADIRAAYDAGGQTLSLDASPNLLPTRHFAGEQTPRLPTVADYGAMLNYDAYAQRSGGVTTAALWTEQRLFGPIGSLSNDGTLRIGSRKSGTATGYLRYDTRLRHIDENRALSFTVGDLITRSLPWSSSVRMGGFQLSRDFHVRPDLITVPLPSFAGTAAVPSAVDLFVDGYRRQSTTTAPGRFVLDNIPVVNGAGQATIVTTDAVGRQVSATIPFYVSSELLKPGILDFSVEAGFLRRNYGLKSFDYGTAAASATLRRGLTRSLTIEAHGEATKRVDVAGAGIAWAPGRFGTINLSASLSRDGASTGRRWSAGYSYVSRHFSISGEHQEQSRSFFDISTIDLRKLDGMLRSNRLIASLSVPRQGSFGLAFFSGSTVSGQRARLLSGSYSRPLGHQASLFLSADHDMRTHTSSVQLRLVMPFGRNMLSGGLSHDRGRGASAQVQYGRSADSRGGLGVDASLAVDEHGDGYGQTTLTYRIDPMEVQAGAAFARSRKSAWGSVTGALVTLGDGVFATRQVNDSFALVATDGVAGVPVHYENQPAGVTNRRGYLFVPNVASYTPGQFSIDTLGLPADQSPTKVEQRIALRQGSGAIIRMPIRHVRSATIVLVDSGGTPLAPGGRVARDNAPDAELGWDGIAYLEDLQPTNHLTVTRRDGRQCAADLTLPSDAPPLARIGPVPCL